MIKVLEKNIADKIAAGEVVDRPLSIVKELVENSIDAGATSITCEIKNGGKDYIRITDDGIGIAPCEMSLAFLRHATSKISYEADLEAIKTLGFRGEALASIAAVSRIKMISKTRDEKTGALLKISGGEVMEEARVGAPDGTSIVVSDLFYNTPARLKFMKSAAAEASLIIDFVSKAALAYSHIKFRLINNETILFASNGKSDKYKNILNIYSKEYADRLIHVTKETENISIEAYISKPDLTKTSRRQQIFFVNGRVISSKVLDVAIAEGYKERLFEGRYPVAFLFLNIKPELLDVNIHPNKKEVRFDDDEAVREFVADAIRQKLRSLNASPSITKKNTQIEVAFKEPVEYIECRGETAFARDKDKCGGETVFVRDNDENVEIIREDSIVYGQTGNSLVDLHRGVPFARYKDEEQIDLKSLLSTLSASDEEESLDSDNFDYKEDDKLNINELKILTVIFNTYILATYDDKVYFIDQHAAHERIYYEKFLKQYKSGEHFHQAILLPIIREVTPALAAFDSEWLELLDKLGFTLEPFGDRTYRLTEIPVFMQISEAESVLDYFLDNIKEGRDIDNFVKIDKLIMRSCKSAVKANDKLSRIECEALLTDLNNCENPYSCPHGRPTFIKLGKNEIEKMFKRI